LLADDSLIFGMRANPKPHETVRTLDGKGAIVQPDSS